MNPNNSKVIIISHREDIDGIVSAALIYSDIRKKGYEHDQIEIHLVDYTSFIALLEANIVELKNHTLYLADIGINEKIYKLLLQLSPIDMLPEGVYRYYYDHHAITGDTFEILQEIKKRFHVYINPSLEHSPINYCTAEVIYYSLMNNDLHFKNICEYAHIGDFKKEEYENHIKLADELKRFITYYQDMNSKLIQLLIAMQTPETWESYLRLFLLDAEEIIAWITIQHEQVEKNLIRINSNLHTIIISIADLKSEDIVYYLIKNAPGYDIYIGFSRRNNYANIQTDLNIAHIIASHFGGGGHPERAGFKIPGEIQDYIYSKKFSCISESFFIKQLKIILSKIYT